MTDKERYIERATECGATIDVNTTTMIRVISANAKVITTYIFNDNGKFKDFFHE